MKKFSFTCLAVLGIRASALAAPSEVESMNPEMRSFYEMLDERGKEQFMKLDQEHKKAAMSIMDQHCKAVHECRGKREGAVELQYQKQRGKLLNDQTEGDRQN